MYSSSYGVVHLQLPFSICVQVLHYNEQYVRDDYCSLTKWRHAPRSNGVYLARNGHHASSQALLGEETPSMDDLQGKSGRHNCTHNLQMHDKPDVSWSGTFPSATADCDG